MSLEKAVTLRLSNEKFLIYEMRAMRAGKKVSPFLRSILEDLDFSSNVDNKTAKLESMIRDLTDQLEALTLKSEQLIEANKKDNANVVDNVTFEILLMLRAMAKPEQMKMAHARMREKNIPVLNLEEF